MAELRESFPSLEDTLTGAGVAAGARIEGQASAAVAGGIGFAFKDATGNVVLPQLNANGQLPVTFEAAGNGKRIRGENSSGSSTQVTVATLPLTTTKKYENITLLTSCYRDATFQLVQNDNGAETILADVRVGPGNMNAVVSLGELEVSAGATGTQQLLVKAKNENSLSALTATVSCKEIG